MSPSSESASPSLTDVLRSVLADMKRASGADIVSLVLYDQDARRYYGPHVIGLPPDSLRESLSDMQSQLNRYLDDEAGGKAPDDLRVTHYGSTAWLTVRRQTLVAKDAPSEIDSTFIRRHHVLSTVGLPLLAEERLVGLLYLNFCADPAAPAPPAGSRAPDQAAVAELERKARESAVRIRSVLTRTQRAAVDSVGRLTRLLTAAADDAGAAGAGLRRQLSIALADLLRPSTRLDRAAAAWTSLQLTLRRRSRFDWRYRPRLATGRQGLRRRWPPRWPRPACTRREPSRSVSARRLPATSW